MPKDKKKPLIQWQLPMQRVLYALAPIALFSIYVFGWRSLFVLAVTNAAAFLSEYLYFHFNKENQPVSSAVFVTGTILAMSLPPTIPFWMAIVAAVVAVIFGKMVFGGFGKNVFNPAMVGRAFIYISFAIFMTARWALPYVDFPGGLVHYGINEMTRATPLYMAKAGQAIPPVNIFFSSHPGSLGEASAILIILGGIFIAWKKAANYRIVVGSLLGMCILEFILNKAGVKGAIPVTQALFSGGFLFGTFFVATDPISASSTDEGRWIFGAFVGIMTVLIRVFGGWAEGMMFAVLLGNMFSPIMDYSIKELKKKKKAPKNVAEKEAPANE